MRYKLVVSDELEFTARILLNDAGVERQYGCRLQASRLPGDALDIKLKTPQLLAKDLLSGQALRLVAWEGDISPLQDAETGKPAPADAEALECLMAVPNMPNVLLSAYLEANGAKAKAGN